MARKCHRTLLPGRKSEPQEMIYFLTTACNGLAARITDQQEKGNILPAHPELLRTQLLGKWETHSMSTDSLARRHTAVRIVCIEKDTCCFAKRVYKRLCLANEPNKTWCLGFARWPCVILWIIAKYKVKSILMESFNNHRVIPYSEPGFSVNIIQKFISRKP